MQQASPVLELLWRECEGFCDFHAGGRTLHKGKTAGLIQAASGSSRGGPGPCTEESLFSTLQHCLTAGRTSAMMNAL